MIAIGLILAVVIYQVGDIASRLRPSSPPAIEPDAPLNFELYRVKLHSNQTQAVTVATGAIGVTHSAPIFFGLFTTVDTGKHSI